MSLPCCDEDDNGVPDFCLASTHCPFHPHNPYTNDNCCCHVCGNIGWVYFDKSRKHYMGCAMWATILAFFVTAFGALSLLSDPEIVKVSHWLQLKTSNTTGLYAHSFVGLSAIVTICEGDETRERLEYNYIVGSYDRGGGERGEGFEQAALLVHDEVLEACKAALEATQFGALLSWVTLIFGFVGTINRRRVASDANVQKFIGLLTDTWGALALSYTVLSFYSKCYAGLPASRGGFEFEYTLGLGFWCYVFCACSGAIRAVAHWLTPTPGNGSGACQLSLPAYLYEKVVWSALEEEDGEGEGDPGSPPPPPRDPGSPPPPRDPGSPPPRPASRPSVCLSDTSSHDDRVEFGLGTLSLSEAPRLSWREQRALCNERHSEAIQHLRTLDHRESVSHLKSKASQGLHSHTHALRCTFTDEDLEIITHLPRERRDSRAETVTHEPGRRATDHDERTRPPPPPSRSDDKQAAPECLSNLELRPVESGSPSSIACDGLPVLTQPLASD